jgi:formate dehydrogenase subunit gamma
LKTDLIPDTPVPLTADQAEAMSQRQFKKHHIAIILLHWFNAIVWLIELVTGLALISAPDYRVVPGWYVSIVEDIFGTKANLLRVHLAVGAAWIFVYLVYGVFGFRTYLRRDVLRNEVGLDRNDVRWLVVRVLGILGRSKEPLPPQGIYNAGQKLFALMVYVMIPVVMVTGIVMAFRLFGPAAVGWAAVLHFGAVGTVVSGLIIHVYMGAVFPEEKPAFFSMITGSVNELYAYTHHFTWWKAVKHEEQAWRDRHAQPDVVVGEPTPDESPAPPVTNGQPTPQDV